MPKEWNDSIIISLYKGKDEALGRENYWSLKPTDHILKVIERIIKDLIRNIVKIDKMQFEFIKAYIHQKKSESVLCFYCSRGFIMRILH